MFHLPMGRDIEFPLQRDNSSIEVAFALAAGLPPDVGLNSAWIISAARQRKR